MIRIAVCDNEAQDLERSYNCIYEYFQEQEKGEAEVVQFSSGADLIESMKERRFDLYFLDILMPGCTGLDVGRAIREIDSSAYIIYVTVSREFSFEAFEIRAFHYLEKPVKKEAVFDILDTVLARIKKNNDQKICVNTKAGMTSIRLNDILYVENVSRAAVYTLKDGDCVLGVCNRGSFEESIRPVSENRAFIQPHKSYFVNMEYIQNFGSKVITLDNGKEISISKKRYSAVKSEYMRFLSEGAR